MQFQLRNDESAQRLQRQRQKTIDTQEEKQSLLMLISFYDTFVTAADILHDAFSISYAHESVECVLCWVASLKMRCE